jgi:hypothetical protein
MIKKLLQVSLLMMLLIPGQLKAQDEQEQKFISADYSVDLVSRYLWRGLLFNANPNIQPYLGVNLGNFTIGSWASYAIAKNYAEVDLFATYTAGNLSFTLYDYYNENEDSLPEVNYFEWKRENTAHMLEGTIAWAGTESFPLKATAAVFFYGNDLNDSLEQNYSTYLELGYPLQVGDFNFDFFAGATLNEGLYSDKANFVNVGFSTSKDIEITEKFSLPVKATFVINPSAKDVFFVAGITF